MSITATELKNNLGKYLLLSATEDVFITKNGKIIAKLTSPYQDMGVVDNASDENNENTRRKATVVPIKIEYV